MGVQGLRKGKVPTAGRKKSRGSDPVPEGEDERHFQSNVAIGILSEAKRTREALKHGLKGSRQIFALIEAIMQDYVSGKLAYRDACILRDMLKTMSSFVRCEMYGRWPVLNAPDGKSLTFDDQATDAELV